MRNLLEGFNSRFELAKERIKKVEYLSIPPIYEYVSEEQKKGEGKKRMKSLRETWDTVK